MNWKLVAGLACGMALLLGACSGNNTTGTTTGTSSGTTPPTDENGGGGDGGGTDSTELTAAKTAFAAAERAVGMATAQAATARRTNTEADRAEARRLIKVARDLLDDAEEAADAAVEAAGDDAANDAARGAAIEYRRDVVRPYLSDQSTILDNAETPFLWFTRPLVRQAIADPDFRVPRGTTTNDEGVVVSRATIVRTPRTKANAAGTAQVENTAPVPIKSTTFKLIPYASGKMVFTSDARHSGAETFKVDGYTNTLNTEVNEPAATVAGYTGLQLTGDGLVVRYGGAAADWTDTRMKLNTEVDDSGTDAGANGWDLTITFDDPQPRSAAKGVTSWQGNGDFYWKARVDAHSSQLTGGANFVDGQLKQPDGYKDLGTYEVWLSNNVGVNLGLEPAAGSGAVTCRDGSLSSANGNACPDDDVQRYLNYAAYGMFLYTADEDGLDFTASGSNQGGRVQSINFGYAAFENKANKRTTNIGKAITSGKFNGRTIAVAYRGNARRTDYRSPKLLSKLVRGDVELTVSIPKTTGTGYVFGHIDGFEEWDAANSRWKQNAGAAGGISLINTGGTVQRGTITRVDLSSNGAVGSATNKADITANTGAFSGIAKATGTNLDGANGVLNAAGEATATGVFKGNFYGPLATPDDLEVAGTWRLGGGATGTEVEESKWVISGSFGAKRAAAPAASN